MKKKPFEVGQKIKFYDNGSEKIDRIRAIRADEFLMLQKNWGSIHPRQVIKRWVKKPKKIARE